MTCLAWSDFAVVLKREFGLGLACVQSACLLYPTLNQLPVAWISFGGVQVEIWPPCTTEG